MCIWLGLNLFINQIILIIYENLTQKNVLINASIINKLSSKHFAQNKTLTGTVRDAIDVVIGASVTVKGDKSIGTITDMDGNFKLSVPVSAKELVVSFIGYEDQTVLIGNKTHLQLRLKNLQ